MCLVFNNIRCWKKIVELFDAQESGEKGGLILGNDFAFAFDYMVSNTCLSFCLNHPSETYYICVEPNNIYFISPLRSSQRLLIGRYDWWQPPRQTLTMRHIFNSSWPRDGIWRLRTCSTSVQVMACCLTAASHYLNQWWITIEMSCSIHLRAVALEKLRM